MNTSDFVQKLQKCNPNIFAKFDSAVFTVNSDQGTIPLYLYGKREDFSEYDKGYMNDVQLDYANRPIKYLTYVPRRYVPYVTKYAKNGIALTPGKRDVLRHLVKLNVITKDQVIKYFQMDFYGDNCWDQMNLTQRVAEQYGEQEDKECLLQQLAGRD